MKYIIFNNKTNDYGKMSFSFMHGSGTNQPHLCPSTKINLGLCSHKLVTLPQPHASAMGSPHQ